MRKDPWQWTVGLTAVSVATGGCGARALILHDWLVGVWAIVAFVGTGLLIHGKYLSTLAVIDSIREVFHHD